MELLLIIGLIIYLIKQSKKYPRKPNRRYKMNPYEPNKPIKIEPLETQTPAETIKKEEPIQEKDFSKAYQAKYLLTQNEMHEFRKLQKHAEEHSLMICPKVRVLDIIEPRGYLKKYDSLRYKVQAKHVDFLICDRDLRIKAIIEIDDNSHNKPDRIERDQFLDQIFQSVGYRIIHTRSITDELLETLK